MILIFFLASLLFRLPSVHSATDHNTSKPICPKSFSCPNSASFKYPFYNVTEKQCGLIKVHCTSNGTKIQFGESYEFVSKFGSDSSLKVHNKTFETLVNVESCEAFKYDFTSPSPLLYSISISPFITIYKCTKNPSYAAEVDAYFNQSDYTRYSICKDHNFYYKYKISDTTAPSDLPPTCHVIQLPMKAPEPEPAVLEETETNIFSLLSSRFSISFQLSTSCDQCHKKDGQCVTQDGQFKCLNAKKSDTLWLTHYPDHYSNTKKVAADTEKPRRKRTPILVLAGSTFILMIFLVIFIIWRCYKPKPLSCFSLKNRSPKVQDGSLFMGVSVFSYTELEDATRNFDSSQELGNGGFGVVYYGKLQDGREVAVKRLYEHNYKRVQYFMNEIKILARLRHPNLVVLYGCTSRQSHELLLVYEYISNGTLADHLHGERANPSLLTWPLRMSIAIETAKALVNLHASEIIHRDVKTTNILLDHNFSVKVADFGLSRLLPNDVTHVSTAPQGTPGYVDPQYQHRYQLTDKSDVYSFGVVLIELISSMKAVDLDRYQDEISLANLALNRIQIGALDQLIDPVLGSDSDPEIMRMVTSVAELAFRCLQFYSEMRPTMNEVLDILEDIQAQGRIDTYDSIVEFENIKPPRQFETSHKTVLLNEFLPSPVSITNRDSPRSITLTVG